MDADTRALIAQLFTKVGEIMEDASSVALFAGSGDHAALIETAEATELAASKIAALASAIRALLAE